MNINGHPLPAAFISALQEKQFSRAHGSWLLLTGRDAFGKPLDTELAHVFKTETDIVQATNQLRLRFIPDETYGDGADWQHKPGYIDDILDFSAIVAFAVAADGSPFCFDFRTQQDPAIIWWEDCYWRQLAPDFTAFLNLFDI